MEEKHIKSQSGEKKTDAITEREESVVVEIRRKSSGGKEGEGTDGKKERKSNRGEMKGKQGGTEKGEAKYGM